jgi:alpha/beta superfamily hydrolase
MEQSAASVFPPSPPQTRISFVSTDPQPLQLEGKITDAKGTWGAVICHPHPLHGGTMDNKVVDAAMRAIASLGGTALRCKYRGVGASEGSFGDAIGEVDDLKGAIAYVQAQHATLNQLWLVGFSFGTKVISHYLEAGGVADGCILIAPPQDHLPLVSFVPPYLGVHMVLGEHDEFCSPPSLHAFRDRLAQIDPDADAPVTTTVIEDTSHFFHGKLPALVKWIRDAVVSAGV